MPAKRPEGSRADFEASKTQYRRGTGDAYETWLRGIYPPLLADKGPVSSRTSRPARRRGCRWQSKGMAWGAIRREIEAAALFLRARGAAQSVQSTPAQRGAAGAGAHQYRTSGAQLHFQVHDDGPALIKGSVVKARA